MYLPKLEHDNRVQLSDKEMNAILENHQIPAEALRTDDFYAFTEQWEGLFMAMINKAMGKLVALRRVCV